MSLTNAEIYERLRPIIADHLDCMDSAVVPDASFMDDLGADSLEIISLITRIEDEFGVIVPDSRFESIQTVRAAIEVVSTLLETKGGR